jgi:predicted ATP-dependent serine protease
MGGQCDSCGLFTWSGPNAQDGGGLVSLAEVDEEEDGPRILVPAARVWGGPRVPGIERGCVYLISGGPGAGKTTLMLMCLDAILDAPEAPPLAPRSALYLGNEQEARKLKSTAVRLRVRNFDRILVPEVRGGIEYPLSEEILACDPCVLVQDSLPGVDGADLVSSISLLAGLRDIADTGVIVIVVNHVNSDGDIAGLTAFQHSVDATFMLRSVAFERGRVVTKRGSPFRRFEAYKNRTGKEVGATLDMTDEGLREHSANCGCDICQKA